MTKKIVKSEMELEHLIHNARKEKGQQIEYKPTNKVLVNGTEVLNHSRSGFPDLSDLLNILEFSLKKGYKPVHVFIDDSIQYLVEHEDSTTLNSYIKNGIKLKNILIPVKSLLSYENCVNNLLKFALIEQAKIISNENILTTYETINNSEILAFENKQWQIKYSIKNNEIKFNESK